MLTFLTLAASNAVLEVLGRLRLAARLLRYDALQLRVRVLAARVHHARNVVRVVHEVDVAHLVVVGGARVNGGRLVAVVGAAGEQRVAVPQIKELRGRVEGLS
jgi:hypothetical protein